MKVDIYLKGFKKWYEENSKKHVIVKRAYSLIPKYLPSPPPEVTEEVQEIVRRLEDKAEFPIYSVAHIIYAGVFISFLVNEIFPKKEIELKINEPFYYLGMFNSGKKLIIKGNVGKYIGFEMKNGRIVIEGDAQEYAGEEMESGVIEIKGNAGEVGTVMKGGKIIVEGNVSEGVGCGMRGGEIIVKGSADWWVGEGMMGGKIYIKSGILGEIHGGDIYIWDEKRGKWKRILEISRKNVRVQKRNIYN